MSCLLLLNDVRGEGEVMREGGGGDVRKECTR